ncbi:MAG: RsmD family RNA methyltransferase [Candidatus Omnitrophota bacterium]
MRIISGRFKGRIIGFPKGIRPTQDKVREALFNILGDISGLSFLDLYAGSGSVGLEAISRGARRVVFVEKHRECLVKIKQNLATVGLSLKRCPGLPNMLEYRVIGRDAAKALEQLHVRQVEKFEIVFLDPPYDKGLIPQIRPLVLPLGSTYRLRQELPLVARAFIRLPRTPLGCPGSIAVVNESLTKKTLKMLSCYDILSSGGLIICQHFKKDILPKTFGSLVQIKQAKYGDTVLSLYKK